MKKLDDKPGSDPGVIVRLAVVKKLHADGDNLSEVEHLMRHLILLIVRLNAVGKYLSNPSADTENLQLARRRLIAMKFIDMPKCVSTPNE